MSWNDDDELAEEKSFRASGEDDMDPLDDDIHGDLSFSDDDDEEEVEKDS